MKIAILMSTYNGGKYLDQQLESIAMQTAAKDICLYIRDDGSRDDTFDIIEKWSRQIPIVLTKGENVGPGMSFWALLCDRSIDADYFLFADQDDTWDPAKVEKSIAALDGDMCLSICNYRIVDGEGKVLDSREDAGCYHRNLKRYFICGIGQGCAMAFDRKLREYILSQKISCIPMHDLIVLMYAQVGGRIIWLQEPLFSYRVHGNNVVAKNNKNLYQKLRTTWWNWKNGSRNSMSLIAKELLENGRFPKEDEKFLKAMANYRHSWKDKFTVLYNRELLDSTVGSTRSYIVRILLNLF